MYNKGPKTFQLGTGGGALYRLVKLSGGKVELNTATDDPVGALVGIDGPGDEGDFASVQFLKDDGTMELETAGAISREADVFAAADGKIQALPSTAGDYRKIGKALQAASGGGSVIEVLPLGKTETVTVPADPDYSAGGTVAANRLVKFDASMDLVHNTADAADDPVAVSQGAGESGDPLPVIWLDGADGPVDIELSGAASAGDDLYAAADGKVQALPDSADTYRHIGIALATGEDEVISVLPYNIHDTETVS